MLIADKSSPINGRLLRENYISRGLGWQSIPVRASTAFPVILWRTRLHPIGTAGMLVYQSSGARRLQCHLSTHRAGSPNNHRVIRPHPIGRYMEFQVRRKIPLQCSTMRSLLYVFWYTVHRCAIAVAPLRCDSI